MVTIPPAPNEPNHPALANWATAVDAILRHIEDIMKVGQLNPTQTRELIATLEDARRQCEEAFPP